MNYLAALILISTPLNAIEMLPLTVNAAKMDYKEKHVTLSGDVVFEHDMGKICAQNMEMVVRQPNAKGSSLGIIHLEEKVFFNFRDRGQLSCLRAEVDIDAREGNFFGDVVYTETCKSKNSAATPFLLSGNRMTLALEKNESFEGSPGQRNLRRISAEGDVKVNYNHDFIAHADKGVYERSNASDNQSNSKIALTMNDGEKRCSVVNRIGDLISASRIEIDTLSKQLVFNDAKGTFASVKEEGKEIQQLEFSCRSLFWNSANDQITMKKDVEIHQAGFGQLKTDGEVRIFQRSDAKKKTVSLLETEGKTIITVQNQKKTSEHILISYGKVAVDHGQLFTTMDSPKDSKGKVCEEEQLSFKDEQGEVFADKATLHYTLAKGKIALSKIYLQGNVRLKDKQPSSDEILHYLVADYVEYLPEEKEMIFTSKARHRVLFYDQVNNVQVSAPALKIKRDDVTKKESVKGLGDVRFSFIDKEYAQIRKIFKLESNEGQ